MSLNFRTPRCSKISWARCDVFLRELCGITVQDFSFLLSDYYNATVYKLKKLSSKRERHITDRDREKEKETETEKKIYFPTCWLLLIRKLYQ